MKGNRNTKRAVEAETAAKKENGGSNNNFGNLRLRDTLCFHAYLDSMPFGFRFFHCLKFSDRWKHAVRKSKPLDLDPMAVWMGLHCPVHFQTVLIPNPFHL